MYICTYIVSVLFLFWIFFPLPAVFGDYVHTTVPVITASYRMWHKDACFACPFLCDWKSQHAGNFVVKHETKCQRGELEFVSNSLMTWF